MHKHQHTTHSRIAQTDKETEREREWTFLLHWKRTHAIIKQTPWRRWKRFRCGKWRRQRLRSATTTSTRWHKIRKYRAFCATRACVSVENECNDERDKLMANGTSGAYPICKLHNTHTHRHTANIMRSKKRMIHFHYQRVNAIHFAEDLPLSLVGLHRVTLTTMPRSNRFSPRLRLQSLPSSEVSTGKHLNYLNIWKARAVAGGRNGREPVERQSEKNNGGWNCTCFWSCTCAQLLKRLGSFYVREWCFVQEKISY